MTKRADEPAATGDDPATDGVAALLTRNAILAAEDIRYEYVDVPEWGGRVRVRSLTGTERDAYDAESWAAQNASKGDASAMLQNFRVRRVARAIVDEAGVRVFADTDIVVLGRKNAQALDRIDDVVARLSGMDTEAVKAALEALKDGPSGGSGTA